MSTLADYHNLYLLTDVLLLADIFEQFRSTCTAHYGLDPVHYYTAPGLSWEAMLKMTEVELEMVTDPDMHLFVESGIRGGVSMISGRHAVANSSYVPDYDDAKPVTHIVYLGANNLYGTVKSEFLPVSDFRWLHQDRIDALDITTIDAESMAGYILKVETLMIPDTLTRGQYICVTRHKRAANFLFMRYSLNLLLFRCQNQCREHGLPRHIRL